MGSAARKEDGNTTKERREFHDKLYTATVQSGGDPGNFLFIMDGYHDCPGEMERPIPDGLSYEDIMLMPCLASTRGFEQLVVKSAIFIRRMLDTCLAPCVKTIFHA